MTEEKETINQPQGFFEFKGNDDSIATHDGKEYFFEKKVDKKNFLQSFYHTSISIFAQLSLNLFFLVPFVIIFGACFIFWCIFTESPFSLETWKKQFNRAVPLVFSISIVYILFFSIKIFISEEGNDIYSVWFLDCFFLLISHIMIFSIVLLINREDYSFDCGFILKETMNSTDAMLIHFKKDKSTLSAIIDIPLEEKSWQKEYQRIIIEQYETQIDSQRYNTFVSLIKHSFIKQFIGYQFISGMNEKLKPHMGQFISLQLVALLKTLCCLSYIIYHSSSFGLLDVLHVLFITLFTTNEIFCLNMILGNYDLRRKTMMNQNINNSIEIAGSIIKYSKVIDIADNHSIETWDNSRRTVYEFFSDQMHKLERSYICLFIYYLFVTNIIVAAYGEIYLFVSKESILLQPLSIISSTFTFILLNMILFFRIYFGTKYNETIDEAENRVDTIIGFYQDLLQLYDYNFKYRKITKSIYLDVVAIEFDDHFKNNSMPDFLYEEEEGEVEEQEGEIEQESKGQLNHLEKESANGDQLLSDSLNKDIQKQTKQIDKVVENVITCYDLIISKFKFISEYNIKQKIQYQGRFYTEEQEPELQKKMIKICLQSFQRIKQQIAVDQKQQSYKILNLVKLDFTDTLFTVLLAFATLLPQLITKFVEQFKMNNI